MEQLDIAIAQHVTSSVPPVFAWRKAFHTGSYGSIYQKLLGAVLEIRHRLVDKR
jgi:hypothetical protein